MCPFSEVHGIDFLFFIQRTKKNVCATEDLGVVVIETNWIVYANLDLVKKLKWGCSTDQSEGRRKVATAACSIAEIDGVDFYILHSPAPLNTYGLRREFNWWNLNHVLAL